ncbi:MAG: UDP-N-acetylmuramoyl-L-alanyl-D-glutamate--2,6-diaminopimelate ligase [Polyangiales bacterium]
MTQTSVRALMSLPGALRLVGSARAEDVLVKGLASDSRRVMPGDAFAALSGRSVDGTKFVAQAIQRGAVAVLAERELEASVPVLVIDNLRQRLGTFAQCVYGDPTRTMPTIGVTGTNGKTTVTHLLESILLAAGKAPALMGTVTMRGPRGEEVAELTTQESDRIARFASESRAAGATHLVLEVSSVALTERRVAGMHFAVAAFTNLSHDHLDYHGTFEAYGEEKARLFTEYRPEASVIVVDAEFGAKLAQRASGRVIRCSTTGADAELRVRNFSSTRTGLSAELDTPAGTYTLRSPLFGAHNLENLLVAIGCAIAVGIDVTTILQALATATGAPGRMERVADPRGVLVLVDYAHSPDAIERALAALRPLTDGRLMIVFGCGGDRDRQKRAPMAEAAVAGADLAILTADNPRTEDVHQILSDMEPGAARHAPKLDGAAMATAARGYAVVPDRAQAIAAALKAAQAGDTVLLAGKGHETYQLVGNTRYAFDDRIQAARALSNLGGS